MDTAALTLRAPWRQRLGDFVEGRRVQQFIVALIVVNAVTLGLETSAAVMAAAGPLLVALDHAILAVFVVEVALRIAGRGPAFFRDPWSLFDFTVVAIALLPQSGPLAVLRALRVLRVLRLISMVPQMRRVVGALLSAIPGLGSIVTILLLLFYVFAVMATKLFGAAFPELFGTLGMSMFTLFQVMTLEGWSGDVVRPVMETYPLAWLFFLPFILITTFTMLNLFIAIIVNAMQQEAVEQAASTGRAVEKAAQEIEAVAHADVAALRRELAQLRELIERRLPQR